MRKKLHLLKWKEMVHSKFRGEVGGLGSLELKNRALLAKLWWRFGDEREPLWRV